MYSEYWQYAPYFDAALQIVRIPICLAVSAHAVLLKRDTRAAIGWVGIIWLTPYLAGILLYVLFGVNRIQRRAQQLRGAPTPAADGTASLLAPQTEHALPAQGAHLRPLAKLVGDITGRQLLAGNRIAPLVNGDAAYPAMVRAIDEATRSITLSTYIFDNDRAGQMFLDALAGAVTRRVEVRVLLDDVGARYTWPSIVRSLRRAGIRVGKFLPTRLPWGFRYSNLRNHRKILVVDGRIGFAGGMNIRQGNLLAIANRHPIQDLHFRIDGPVVAHLQEVFAFDWRFCEGELLEGEAWFPSIDPAEDALARGISDGPDEDSDKSRLTMLGAISCARQSLCIATPYFLPDGSLITSLCVAAMRGVSVDIVLPEKNNLTLVQWASMAVVGELLERGCRVWLSPPPFDHTKLMLVDELWSLIGSTNWDPRSLRLNFEFNVECYDAALAKSLAAFTQKKMQASRLLTLADIHGRSLAVKLRDGVTRLGSPYL